jgi:hypothetical protein
MVMHNPKISPDELRTDALKPALASIPDACKYMGDISRAKFYSDVLPLLETIHIGSRHLVVIASMDRLIDSLKEGPADNQNNQIAAELSRNSSSRNPQTSRRQDFARRTMPEA